MNDQTPKAITNDEIPNDERMSNSGQQEMPSAPLAFEHSGFIRHSFVRASSFCSFASIRGLIP
jgi:hypothetical protein